MKTENVEITTLEDGLRIVTQKADFNDVFIGAWIKVGLVNESDEENGLSHFLEHMVFKGTETKTALELSDYIEKLGGECNAYTSTEETVIHTSVLPEYWKFGVDFLADVIQNSTFPKYEIERERNVIMQEIAMYENDQGSEMYNQALSNMYSDDPMGRTILGPRSNIQRFTRDDLVAYYNKWYTPDNIVISACGDIDHEEFVNYVKEQFRLNFRSSDKPEIKSSLFKVNESRKQNIFSQSQFLLTAEGPNFKNSDDKDRLTLQLLWNIIDGGMSCRLFQEIREKNGLAYHVSLSVSCNESTGFFGVYAALKEENIEKAINLSKQVLESAKHDIKEEELEKAKNSILYGLARKYDSCSSIATSNAQRTMFNLGYKDYDEIKEIIEEITMDDVIKCANKYIPNTDEDRYSLSIMTPYETLVEKEQHE